jgi:hypothetical protein
VISKKYVVWWVLVGVLLLAIWMRFVNFGESIYFGFDEARDAYVSRAIYESGELKMMGPPATGDLGLYHGPLYWYLLGPVYSLAGGDPVVVSAVFRVVNALLILPLFWLVSSMFGKGVAGVSVLLYAVSFEQNQYAMYVGNPAWGVWAILMVVAGAWLLREKNKHSYWGLYLSGVGAALATQFNLMYGYLFVWLIALIVWRWSVIKGLGVKHMIGAGVATFVVLSSYILVEMRFGFRTVKKTLELMGDGFGVMAPGQSKYSLYWEKYMGMFQDNIWNIEGAWLWMMVLSMSIWLLIMAVRENRYRVLMGWLTLWVVLMLFGGHTAYYTNVGMGLAVIVLTAIISMRVWKLNRVVAGLLLFLILYGNATRVIEQSPKGLIDGIKPQPGMLLADQYRLIDRMYEESEGEGFTVRVTGIPYRIQTVWAYLFENYALPKYGYLPYYETGNTLGFPGSLPVPTLGTTCHRYLIREPMRGLPVELVEADVAEEDIFSNQMYRDEVGGFIFESRYALEPDCHGARAEKI